MADVEAKKKAMVKRMFDRYDKEKKGHITLEQFKKISSVSSGVEMTDAQAEMVMKLVDKDASGTIDFEEFWDFWKQPHEGSKFARCAFTDEQLDTLKKMQDLFDQVDQDKNGVIDKAEFPALYEELKKAAVKDLGDMDTVWNELDADGNGNLCFAELVAYVQDKFDVKTVEW